MDEIGQDDSSAEAPPLSDRNQRSTSCRFQPMPRPRKRSCLGKRPSSVSAERIHRWRRVSRATSCAV